MKKMAKMTALALSALMLLSACSSGGTAPSATGTDMTAAAETNASSGGETASAAAAAGAQEMTFVLHNEPDGIDPGVTSNSFASPFLTNCFEGLVTYNSDSELAAGMAQDWTISPDGLVYTFNLRKDLKWSDGSPLTAEDFVYSIQRVLKPETAAQYVKMVTGYIENAEEIYDGTAEADTLGVKALDDTTLEITLTSPAPFFLDILSMAVYAPVQKATVEANGDRWTLSPETYVVNGPFKITQMNMGESVVLEKNPEYYGADDVALEKLTFRYIRDQATALSAFESGEIDGLMSVPAADLARLKAESDDIYTVPMYATTYYLLNMTKPPYDNVLVRKAINLAIDRQAIIDNVLQGGAQPAYSLVAPGYAASGTSYEDGRGTYGLSPNANSQEAKRLLAEAGYPDGKGFPTIQLSYYTNPQVKQIVEAMADMLKTNLGVEVEISNEEWAVYYDGVQSGNYEIAAMGWGGDYLHPMTFLGIYEEGSPTNNSGYVNKDYEALLVKAKTELDPVKAIAIMREAEDLFMEDYPLLTLYYRAASLMMKEKVQNWYLTPTNNLYFREVSIRQ